MKSITLFRHSPRRPRIAALGTATLGLAALGIVTLFSVGCPSAQEPSETAETAESAEPAEPAEPAENTEMNAESLALQLRQEEALAAEAAAIEAANKALAEREAVLQLREEQLRQEEALRQEQARVAQRKAETEERERRLAAKEKELENYEANLAFQEKELRDRETALEESTAASEPVEAEFFDEADSLPQIAATPSEVQPETGRPEPVYASLEPGRLLEIEFEETVSSATHRQGDTFSARLVQDLTAEDGTLVVAAGTEVIGRVTQVTPLKKVGGRASIEVEFTHLVLSPTDSVAISASFVEMGVDKRKDKKKIAGAAIVGAILGRILGGDGAEGVLAGAAAGAAAGTVAVTRGEGKDAEIPSGQIVALQLEEVVTVEIQMTGPVDQ